MKRKARAARPFHPLDQKLLRREAISIVEWHTPRSQLMWNPSPATMQHMRSWAPGRYQIQIHAGMQIYAVGVVVVGEGGQVRIEDMPRLQLGDVPLWP